MRTLLASYFALASAWAFAVPDVVRDTPYDWRCVAEDGTLVSNHQRQDKAIVACQRAAQAIPGALFYVEGGRYRVIVESPETPSLGSAIVSWAAVPGATSYTLYFDDGSGYVGAQTTENRHEYTDLQPGTYRWYATTTTVAGTSEPSNTVSKVIP